MGLTFLPAIIHNFEGEVGGVCLATHSSAALDLHSLKARKDWILCLDHLACCSGNS